MCCSLAVQAEPAWKCLGPQQADHGITRDFSRFQAWKQPSTRQHERKKHLEYKLEIVRTWQSTWVMCNSLQCPVMPSWPILMFGLFTSPDSEQGDHHLGIPRAPWRWDQWDPPAIRGWGLGPERGSVAGDFGWKLGKCWEFPNSWYPKSSNKNGWPWLSIETDGDLGIFLFKKPPAVKWFEHLVVSITKADVPWSKHGLVSQKSGWHPPWNKGFCYTHLHMYI